MMKARYVLLAVVPTLLASVAEASVPTEAAAVVALDGGATREALVIERAVKRWVDESARAELVDLAEFALGDALTDKRGRAERAVAIKRSGIEAYDMMSYETALMRLDRAIEAFEQTDLTENLDKLLDAYFMRALTLFYAGQPSRARNQVLDIFALNRGFTPDRNRVTPEIESILDEARRSIDEAPPTTLEIQTDPVPAWVFVDGRFRGISPVELTDLQPGHHFVSARAPGYRLTQERHLAAPGQIARLRLEQASKGEDLTSRLQNVRMGLGQQEPASAVRSVARWVGSDNVLAVGVRSRDDGVALEAWRFAADGHLISHAQTRLSRREVASAAAISNFLDQVYAAERPRGPDGEPISDLHVGRTFNFEFDHRGWGMIAGGTGVATAVGGLLVGLSARGLARDARNTPQLDYEGYQSTLSGAKRRAALADGMYVFAAVATAAGIYLYLQDEPPWARQGEIDAPPSTGLALVPARDGATLTLSGSF